MSQRGQGLGEGRGLGYWELLNLLCREPVPLFHSRAAEPQRTRPILMLLIERLLDLGAKPGFYPAPHTSWWVLRGPEAETHWQSSRAGPWGPESWLASQLVT